MARKIELPRTEAEWQRLNYLVSQGILGYDAKTGRIIPEEEMRAAAEAKRAGESKTDPHIFAPLFKVIREFRQFQKTRTKVTCAFPDMLKTPQNVPIQKAHIAPTPCRRLRLGTTRPGGDIGSQLRFRM